MTLRWVPGWNGLTDPDAVSYVAAVEAADGQELEFGVAKAINDFVLGCKNDDIWDAIKACCILAGARTLAGALVPLVGTAPTNFNFVSGDYNRETGLKGDGSTKYLDSNRLQSTDSITNVHASVYQSSVSSSIDRSLLGTGSGADTRYILQSDRTAIGEIANIPGLFSSAFLGITRNNASSYTRRNNGSNQIISNTYTGSSFTFSSSGVFARFPASGGSLFSNARIAFYSIGESLDLAKLDTRVSNLITAIGAAIP